MPKLTKILLISSCYLLVKNMELSFFAFSWILFNFDCANHSSMMKNLTHRDPALTKSALKPSTSIDFFYSSSRFHSGRRSNGG